MGRHTSVMLRRCFSSAGTGSILKIKGSLYKNTNYMEIACCKTTFFHSAKNWSLRELYQYTHQCTWQNWQSNERLSAGCKKPNISFLLSKEKDNFSFLCPQNVPISLFLHSHSRWSGSTTVFTDIVLFICILKIHMQILCQFGYRMWSCF